MTQTGAILSAILAYFGWVVWDALIKYGAQITLSPSAILGIIGMSGAACVLVWAFANKQTGSLKMRPVPAQFIPAFCTLANNYLNVLALHHLPLTLFYVVVFTTPFAIAVAVVLMRHEKMTKFKMISLAVGLGGVLIALSPGLGMGGDGIGYLAGFTSVICFTLYTVTISKVGGQVSKLGMLFYNSLLVGAVGTALSFNEIVTLKPNILGLMIAAGLVNILANACYNRALHHTSSTNVAALHYTQMIWGAMIGYLIWNEQPSWRLGIGSLIIIASGLAVMRAARRSETLPPIAPIV